MDEEKEITMPLSVLETGILFISGLDSGNGRINERSFSDCNWRSHESQSDDLDNRRGDRAFAVDDCRCPVGG